MLNYEDFYGILKRFEEDVVSNDVRRGSAKSWAFPISYFPICSTTERIFLGWVKEVRTMTS
jgi:hypothetical protein